MKIAVIDGQGGGMGRALVAELKARMGAGPHTILALGTNSLATQAMLKAGAHEGATGENAIVYNAARVGIIAGPIGIVLANALLGELSPKMAEAIAMSPAQKVLIPMERCQVHVVGAIPQPLQVSVEQAVTHILSVINS